MKRLSCLVLSAVILAVASLPAAAQKFQPKTIQFKGDPEYTDQELMTAAGLKKGEVLDYAEMNEHSQRLMDTGVFEGLTFKFDGQDLIFMLKPAKQLFPIRLENLPLAQGKDLDAKLHELFPLYHGMVPVEDGLVERVRQTLEQMLTTLGIKATVAVTPYTDMKLHKVTAMTYAITAPQVVVGEIHSDTTLEPKAAEVLDGLAGSPYSLDGSPNQIETNLGNYYRDKGYLEAEIHASAQSAPVIAPDSVRIPFQVLVATGPIYKIVSIQLAPGVLVTQADFDKQSGIRPGMVADATLVRENWAFLARQYHNQGYMKANIQPTPSFDHVQGTVSYSVTAEPGPVYKMGAVSVENVSEQLRAAMLAAWKMPAGSVFNEKSVRDFYTIGDGNPTLAHVFANVNCKYVLSLNDNNHTVDVKLRLEKR
jgi:outer membrane protein insertion porin family